MNWWEDQRAWSLNTLWRRWQFVMFENCFLMYFFKGGDVEVNSKISACTSFTNARSLQKNSVSFWNSLSLTASSASTRNSINNYKVQPWVHLSPLSLHMEHSDRFLDYSCNHPISENLSATHTLICRAKQVCSTPELVAKEMDHLHKVLQDNHYPGQYFQQSKPNGKPIESQNHLQESL